MKRILVMIAMFFVAFLNIRVLFCKERYLETVMQTNIQGREKALNDFRASAAWNELSAQQLLNLLDKQIELVDLLVDRKTSIIPEKIEKIETMEFQAPPSVRHVYNSIMDSVTADSRVEPHSIHKRGRVVSEPVRLTESKKKQYLRTMKKNLQETFRAVQKMQYDFAIAGMMNMAKITKKKTSQQVKTASSVNNVKVCNNASKPCGSVKADQKTRMLPSKVLWRVIDKHLDDVFAAARISR